MKVRLKDHPNLPASSSDFNTSTTGEVIVSYGEDGADSDFISKLDVYLEATGEWKDMAQAFKDRDIIPDNYNRWFGEPKTDEDRLRGYFQ